MTSLVRGSIICSHPIVAGNVSSDTTSKTTSVGVDGPFQSIPVVNQGRLVRCWGRLTRRWGWLTRRWGLLVWRRRASSLTRIADPAVSRNCRCNSVARLNRRWETLVSTLQCWNLGR
jgi:hypothetical protein